MVAALALAASAEAANQPRATFDAIASEVAGYPASVWCENDPAAWAAMAGEDAVVGGFIRWTPEGAPQPVAYIGPAACGTLHDAVSGIDAVPIFSLASGLLTLLHESVHLRGLRDEGETSCAALALVPDFARRYFSYREWKTEKRVVRRWVRVKRKIWVPRDGRRVRVTRLMRVRVKRTVTVRVPDPELPELARWALIHHRAQPAEYQGSC